MNRSEIILEFSQAAQFGDTISVDFDNCLDPQGFKPSYEFTYVFSRSGVYEITRPSASSVPGENAMTAFIQAATIDLGLDFIFEVLTPTSVKITNTNNFNGSLKATFQNTLNLAFSGYVSACGIAIQDIQYLPGDCAQTQVEVTTSEPAESVTSPVQLTNPPNPFTFTIPRGQVFDIELSAGGKTDLESGLLVPFLTQRSVQIQQNNTPVGADVTILVDDQGVFNLTYSLDGTNYQASNVFNAQLSGDYTVYVRDGLGCEIIKDFTVDEFSIGNPFAQISELNSYRLKRDENWGDAENYKTWRNTLANEVEVPLQKRYYQKYQTADTVTTQIKTNYRNIRVLANLCDNVIEYNYTNQIGVEDTSKGVIQKKSNSLGIKERLTATKFSFLKNGINKQGYYFYEGFYLDYNGGAQGESYSLLGSLPRWAKIGQYVQTSDDVWRQITEIVTYESPQGTVKAIILNGGALPANDNLRVIYNNFNYDIIEFSIDNAPFLDKKYQIRVELSDPNFETVSFLSEIVDVKVRHKHTLDVVYFQEENNDVFWQTGIKGKLRIELKGKELKDDGEIENLSGDSDTYPILRTDYVSCEFSFGLMPSAMSIKLRRALKQNEVLLDGVAYALKSFDTGNKLGDTDYYKPKAILVERGDVLSSNEEASAFDTSNINIPGLVSGSSQFVDYGES